MAVLMDEYEGTSGLVTAEDILDEIVGEIRDEFDIDEKPMIQKIDQDQYIIDGKVLITEVNELFHVKIDHDEIDTIGGWILTDHFDVKEGDTLEVDNFQFKVLEMEDHHIKSIEVRKK